jgi:hypothetical protein
VYASRESVSRLAQVTPPSWPRPYRVRANAFPAFPALPPVLDVCKPKRPHLYRQSTAYYGLAERQRYRHPPGLLSLVGQGRVIYQSAATRPCAAGDSGKGAGRGVAPKTSPKQWVYMATLAAVG